MNKSNEENTLPPSRDKVRLNKYISNCGVCSRREADLLIEKGLIKVNGKVINTLGSQIDPTDTVEYKGQKINPTKKVYLLLNKPKDYITTVRDTHSRKTVMDLLKNITERVFPVGRLDRNSTGLLVFTNDGDLAKKLIHPSSNIKKIYQVKLNKPLSAKDKEKISKEGVSLDDGIAHVDQIEYLNDEAELGIELHSGKNRIIRRIFEALNYNVISLDRVTFAGLNKKGLSRGKYRLLTEIEVANLHKLVPSSMRI